MERRNSAEKIGGFEDRSTGDIHSKREKGLEEENLANLSMEKNDYKIADRHGLGGGGEGRRKGEERPMGLVAEIEGGAKTPTNFRMREAWHTSGRANDVLFATGNIGLPAFPDWTDATRFVRSGPIGPWR